MDKSTSLNKIDSYHIKNAKEKIFFLLNNFIDHIIPRTLDPKLSVRNYQCDFSGCHNTQQLTASSPSRFLCDLFWKNLPWPEIKRELGSINILDIGCGSGRYYSKLQNWSGNIIDKYAGSDIKQSVDWAELKKNNDKLFFFEASALEISKFIPSDTNLIITQSAIEHFQEDLLFFEKIRDYINKSQNNVIQIHLFPSAACLWLYLLHGVRQYTPGTVSKITRLFNANSHAVLYGLGGKNCNRLHFRYITWPFLLKPIISKKVGQDWRNTKIEEYNKHLASAIDQDMARPSRSPSFYALVIQSNFQKKIFN